MLPRILLFCLLFSSTLTAQLAIEVFEEEVDKGVDLFIKNDEYCPVTFVFKLQLRNMTASPMRDTLVVPARTERFAAYKLRLSPDARQYGYGYEHTSNFGDHTTDTFTIGHVYELPFAPGTSQVVSQGYNGKFSHQGALSLDFDMPEGTPIHAARGGVVAIVEERFDRGCPSARCLEYTNEVVILHDDGTFGEYVHLRQNGALVERGDRVETGQLIGESGATGFANGPHLHFSVYRQRMKGRQYIPTVFRVAGSQVPGKLEERRRYGRPLDR
ncbi:MAG: M23 family metallopeptidase [Bacteroidota bacterium]